MAMAIEIDGLRREVAEIAISLHESFRGVVDFETVAEVVNREFGRYAHAPIKDFVPLLVERDVRARLRELGAG